MAVDFKIKEFLWCKDPDAGAKGSDKIWGWVEVEGKLYNFWGRRAEAQDQRKHLTFKLNSSIWGASGLQEKTQSKLKPSGKKSPYQRVSVAKDSQGVYGYIEAVYPNFTKSFQNQLMMAKLGDNIRNAGRFLDTGE
jgi:hypothetical protein